MIKDQSYIELLQNKINNSVFTSENELVLTLNTNLLEHRQEIIGRLVISQNEQLTAIKSNTSTSWLYSIDYWTVLKIGGIVLIVGGIIWGGYSYFNTNAVKTAGEIGKKALEGTSQSSNLILEGTEKSSSAIIDTNVEMIKDLKEELIKTKADITKLTNNLTDVYSDMKEQNLNISKIASEINKNSGDNTQSLVTAQEKAIGLNQEAVIIDAKLFKTVQELVVSNKNMNDRISNLSESLHSTNTVLSNVNATLYGGKIIENFSAEAPQEIPKEVSSLVTEVAEMSQAVNGNIASIQAILSFLGMNIPLSNLAQRMFLKIQNDTRRQNVYQDNAYQNNEGDTEL